MDGKKKSKRKRERRVRSEWGLVPLCRVGEVGYARVRVLTLQDFSVVATGRPGSVY